MKSRNNFSGEDRRLFDGVYECWYCGMNTNDSGHHIMGRGYMSSTTESSILNCAPICNFKCHLKNHGKISTTEWQKKFLKKTYEYLMTTGYSLTVKDREFVIKYKHLYGDNIIR